MPTSPTHLAPIDLALVAIYLVAITIFGLQFSKRNKVGSSLKSYFLADNTIPWWAIALSIVSAETSTLTIVSIPGVAFAGDLGFLQVVLGYMLGRVVVAALFLPRYFRGEMLTAYQLIDRRFGPALHKLTAGLFLLTRAAAEGVRVFAISIVVSVAIGTGDTLSIAIISALTLLYTFEGGMAAVIWTDVVQMALYVAGTVVALFTLGAHVPGGWQHIHAVAAPLGKFHWLDFSFTLTRSYTFWAGVLGGTFLTMASHGTDQLMVQRMLAARNLRESRLALLSSGVVIFAQFFLFLLIGVGLFVFYSTHPAVFKTNDYIFPSFIVHEMPHGIAGLLIAAILAAAMSNLSAALNSLASTTVIDFYVPFKSRVTSRSGPPGLASEISVSSQPPTLNTNLISRLSTIFWAIILFAIAIYAVHAGGKGHVVETGLSIASVAYGCLLGVFLLGTLTRYATQTGAIVGMIAGLATNLTLWQASLPQPFIPMPNFPHIAFTWYVLIGSAVTFVVGTLFSITLRRQRTVVAAVLLCLFLHFPFRSAAQESAVRTTTTSGAPSFAPSAKGGVPSEARPLSSNSPQTLDFTPISTLINDAIAAHKLPGAVVLIGHNGKVVFEHAYGNRKLAGEPGLDGKPSPAEPMTTDTIFDMASLTKVLVTTTAILQLYEQGKLSLDAPVAKYLPDFAQNGKDKITIRQLLTHYSGLPEDISLKDDWGLAKPDKAEGLRRAMAAVPYGPPGVTFKYSDINFITLGFLVEKLTGKSLEDYARDRIFIPLAMQQTRYLPADQSCGASDSIPYAAKSEVTHLLDSITAGQHSITVCRDTDWDAPKLIPRTAPTAHDDQGTPTTNPDFDHLLRGTVDDPTTRRMGGVAGHAGVFSTAEDASKFCTALLQKLRDNTGPFPLKQSTLQMATSPQAPSTAVTTATIFTQDGQTTTGVAQRGLGWDLNSAFSRPRGTLFPITTGGYGKPGHPGSFGHTGFTGTSLWLDPVSDTYVILFANAIHPRGNPTISPLRGQVATAAARALGITSTPGAPGLASETWVSTPPQTLGAPSFESHPKGGVSSGARPLSSTQPQPYDPTNPCTPPVICDSFGAPSSHPVSFQQHPRAPFIAPHAMSGSTTSTPTLTGIDVLESTHFAALKTLAANHHNHLNIGLLTNQSGLDREGQRTIDILAHAPGLTLLKIFTPEHGLLGKQDTERLIAETDPTTHIPVISLFGAHPADRHPRPADLAGLDAVVIDLQDIGTRFWTYETVLRYFLEATSCRNDFGIIVLDRPNPIGGLAVQGPISDPPQGDPYVNSLPMPVRHGLTYGELARYFMTKLPLAACSTPQSPFPIPPLTVIAMQNWSRQQFFPDTGLPWTPPSPNMKHPSTAIVYPAVALLETTNLSVGRGTPNPYEKLGAPWMTNPEALSSYLEARHVPGIHITPTTLTIAETPEHYPSHGQTIPGIHLEVTDRTSFDSPEFGIELLAALHKLYPTQFQLDRAKTLLANADTLAALKQGRDPNAIAGDWLIPLAQFSKDSEPFLLYPR